MDIITLSLSGTSFAPRYYAGDTSQSFDLIPQGDGSTGIRWKYGDLVLTTYGSSYIAAPYSGITSQSFDIIHHPDGSSSILGKYNPLVMTMTETGLSGEPYIEGNRNQRFNLFPQGDGSIGIRKISRSLFRGTPDSLTAIMRIGKWFLYSVNQCTGFYSPRGTQIQLNLELIDRTGTASPVLWIGAHYADQDTTFSQPRAYPLRQGINSITDLGGGAIYITLSHEQNTATLAFLSGAIEMPVFDRDSSSEQQFLEMLRVRSSSPIVELTSNRALITVSREAALAYQTHDHASLMDTFEQIINMQELEILGLDDSSPLHASTDLKYHLILGNYGGAGSAHASHGYTAYDPGYAEELLSPDALKRSWAVPHELGHQNQMHAYLTGDFIEVTNNINALAAQRAFGVISNLLVKDPENKDTWDRALHKQTLPETTIEDLDAFERLAALEQLRLSFGNSFWANLNKICREQWIISGHPFPDRETAFNNLALYGSMAANTDLRNYFEAWGMPISASTRQAIAMLNIPSPAIPIETLREPPLAGNDTESSSLRGIDLNNCTLPEQ